MDVQMQATDFPRTAPAWATEATEQRVEELLKEMTLEERIAFVTGDLNWDYGFYSGPLERLGLPALQMADGPAGIRICRGNVHDGQATALPAPIALAATWDPELAREYGAVIGIEARATDHNVSLGPAVDIARVGLGGRTFESYGEDPRLAAAIGVEYVRGVQDQGVQACAKHFAINNQEDHRFSIDAVVDERTLRELYLPPFEALIAEGEVASVMASFNRVNGVFACENPWLLTHVLRELFGFRGWVMSDFGANHSTTTSANAGLDQEQPTAGHWGDKLLEAVRGGEVAVSTIDEMVRRILRPLIGMGQLENPVGIDEFPVAEHHAVAQQIAEASMVLLRNDGILPLAGVQRVALIGPDVDSAGARGGGSSLVRATQEVSPLEGLTSALGDDVEITVEYGSELVTAGVLLPGPDAVPSAFFQTPDGEPGLHAEFWANPNFNGEPLVARTESQIELYMGFHNFPGCNANSPRYPSLPMEVNGRASVRWAGSLTVPVTGVYTFTVTWVGSFSLSLAGQTVASSTVEGRESDAFEAHAADEVDAVHVAESSAYPQLYVTENGNQAYPLLRSFELSLVAGTTYPLQLDYAADDPVQGSNVGTTIRLGWVPPQGVVSPAVTAAATAAAAADVAVVVVRTYEAENDDRPHMTLPSGQNELIRAVLAANPRTVVVLMTGAPVDVTSWGAEPAALLQAWFPGQAQGDALARVLTGVVEPGGRLPLTLPRNLSQTPAVEPRQYPGVDGRAEYTEGVFVGYRAVEPDGPQPAYPFGHGLSYTSFAYDDLEIVDDLPDNADLVATASVTVRNVGARRGSDVVQAYAGTLPGAIPTPARQLAAFAKVTLEPGESARIRLEVPRRAVSYFDDTAHDWATPLGDVELFIGASSDDPRLSGSIRIA